jgi:D-amino-acid oxidase
LKPDEKTGQRIIDSCCRLSPELKSLSNSGKLEIVAHKVGLRPGRKGGVRLEGMLVQDPKNAKRDVLLVHNYGHGGFGYQSSWGCAESVLTICSSHIKKQALPAFIQSLLSKL